MLLLAIHVSRLTSHDHHSSKTTFDFLTCNLYPTPIFNTFEQVNLTPSTVSQFEDSTSPLQPRVALALAVAQWRGAEESAIKKVFMNLRSHRLYEKR